MSWQDRAEQEETSQPPSKQDVVESTLRLLNDYASTAENLNTYADELHPMVQAMQDSGLALPELDDLEKMLVHASTKNPNSREIITRLSEMKPDNAYPAACLYGDRLGTMVPQLYAFLGRFSNTLRSVALAIKEKDETGSLTDEQESAIFAFIEAANQRAPLITNERQNLAAALKLSISDVSQGAANHR